MAAHSLGLSDPPLVLLHVDLQVSHHLLNTFGAIEVFRRAFHPLPKPLSPPNDSSPRLLILVEHGSASHPEFQFLQACCAYDPCMELRVIDGLPVQQQLALIADADVLLSLQRSYALPSLLASAQAMGLQVIATAYGAALDLPDTANLQLVPASPVPIGRNAFPDAEGFLWGEPDQDAAIIALRRAVSTPHFPQPPIDDEARANCGLALRERLQLLWQEHRQD